MLQLWIRSLYSDNGTLSDVTIPAHSRTGTFDLAAVAAEDYLYVGQDWPFNNIFFDMNTVNSNASIMTADYWDGGDWRAMVDVVDDTAVSGVTLAKSGTIQWVPDDAEAWTVVDDTTEGDGPSELSSVELYNLYWMRFKWSADLSASTKVKRMTYAFTDSEALLQVDPNINNFLTAWTDANGDSSKLDWNEQIILATQNVIMDLRGRKLIKTGGNLLRGEDLYWPAAWKTLELIYFALGKSFTDQMNDAEKRYNKLMEQLPFTKDTNRDARASRSEVSSETGGLFR